MISQSQAVDIAKRRIEDETGEEHELAMTVFFSREEAYRPETSRDEWVVHFWRQLPQGVKSDPSTVMVMVDAETGVTNVRVGI